MAKYRLTLNEIQRQGNIEKLERDGFSKHDIHKVLYKEGEGATRRQQEDIISKLYDRTEHSKK